jgi:hypothetical protein
MLLLPNLPPFLFFPQPDPVAAGSTDKTGECVSVAVFDCHPFCLPPEVVGRGAGLGGEELTNNVFALRREGRGSDELKHQEH